MLLYISKASGYFSVQSRKSLFDNDNTSLKFLDLAVALLGYPEKNDISPTKVSYPISFMNVHVFLYNNIMFPLVKKYTLSPFASSYSLY